MTSSVRGVGTAEGARTAVIPRGPLPRAACSGPGFKGRARVLVNEISRHGASQ